MSTPGEMAPHGDHYAIVLGLSRYPRLGDPPPADLLGPGNDAAAVVTWLTNPHEGGLPPGNVNCIVSKNSDAPPDARPTRGDLEAAFLWLDDLAGKNQDAGRHRRVGTRLYLYASGHGFSPRYRQGCLLAGDAAQRQYSANVFPSAWIDWLQDAEYFREFVLWMDCCMDRQVLTQPSPPPLDPIGSNNAPPGPSFIAFGATRPLKAVEKSVPADDNKIHGIFTWNLLQGLRGAAANSIGVVTGRSLADWVIQSQLAWLDDAERASPDVAKEPAIVDQDDRVVFARGVQPFDFAVTLHVQGSTRDQTARLWSGPGAKPGGPFTIAAAGTTLGLKPGLYLAEVPELGLRHGFAVVRSGDVWLNETGNSPREAQGRFTLSVDPGDATSDIRLVGDFFRSVESAAGALTCSVPYGLYQLRIRVGRQIVEKVILLDSDWPTQSTNPAIPAAPPTPGADADTLPPMPPITSAAPLPQTRTTREYHEHAVMASRQRIDVTAGAGAELMVMARAFSSTGIASAVPPWGVVNLLDSSGQPIADLAAQGQRGTFGDPWVTCTLAVAPGTYVLEHSQGMTETTATAPIAQPLVVPAGWRLEVYLLKRLDAFDRAGPLRVSLLMRRMGAAPEARDDDLLVEKARVALADERPALSGELSLLLGSKFDTPLAGIIGAHLLLIDHETTGRSLLLLDTMVRNLRLLVGPDHPDVEALSLRCIDNSLRATKPFVTPPLYERSWRLMVGASQSAPAQVPLSLWNTVHATVSTPPFLMWISDAETRQTYRKAVADALFGSRGKASGAPARPALAVPGWKLGQKRYIISPDRSDERTPGRPAPAPAAPAPTIARARLDGMARDLDLPPTAVEALQAEYTAKR